MSSAKNAPQVERPSDEADQHQLALAREEGDAYQRSLRYMEESVAETGGQQQAGDYVVGFAQERAEGMWRLDADQPVWSEPADNENCHLEVAVADAGDGRFIPYLQVHATLIPEDGRPIGPFEVPFVWHPGLYHYGRNIQVPGPGKYTLRIHIQPPTFMRHDRVNGKRYVEPVEVEFPDVQIQPGRE